MSPSFDEHIRQVGSISFAQISFAQISFAQISFAQISFAQECPRLGCHRSRRTDALFRSAMPTKLVLRYAGAVQ
jgi:hypothetical protein